MAATAVGLFVSSSVAEAVVDALRAHGMPSRGIRTVGQAANFPVPMATSPPANDVAARLARDLRSMGATDREIEAYLDGVQRGNVLVLLTGSLQQADAASAIMNQFTALEVEEYANASKAQVQVQSDEQHGVHSGFVDGQAGSLKAERMQARGDGARLFSW